MGFVPNLNINAKKLVLYSFWNSLCVRKIEPVYACRKLHAQADSCVREGFLGLILPKIDLFAH